MENRHLTEPLKTSEEWFRCIFESSRDAIFIISEDTQIIDANAAAVTLTGYSKAEIKQMRILDFHDSADLQEIGSFEAFFSGVISGDIVTLEAKFLQKNGRKIDVEFNNCRIVVEGVPYLYTTARDITERKQTEQKLRQIVAEQKQVEQELRRSEELYRSLAKNFPGAIALFDPDLRYLVVEGPKLRELNINAADLLGKTMWEVFPVETCNFLEPLSRDVLAGINRTIEAPFSDRIFWVTGVPVRNEQEEIYAGMVIIQEITQQKRVEQELRRAEKLYRTLAENIPGGVVLYDHDLRFLLANGPTFTYINLDPAELTGKTLGEVFGLEAAQTLEPLYRAALAGETRIYEGTMAGYDYISYYLPIRDDQGEVIMGMAFGFDITSQKQAERELRHAEELYRTLAENFPGGVALFDHDFRYLLLRGSVMANLGITRAESEGKTLLEVFGSEIANLVEPQYQAALEGEMTALEIPAGPFVFKQYGVPVRDEQGEISMGMAISLDITEQKRAEQERQRVEALYRTMAENFPNGGVSLFDQNLRYLLVDGPGIADWGLTKAEIEGKTLGEILPPEMSYLMEPYYQAALAGETHTFDLSLGEISYRLYTLPIRNDQGQIVMGMALGQNITQQKQAEEALQRSRDELEIRVQERTQQLREANAQLAELTDELSRSNQELEQFAYIASHDLQEPLRAISSYTQLLARRYQGQLDEKADKYIGYAVDGATRMQQLIQDLLAYSRVGRHELQPTPTDCNVIVQQVLNDLQIIITENQAEITVDPLPTLLADANQLKQLFQNLVGNALKYRSAEIPRIRIDVTTNQESAMAATPSNWLFSIQDNGIGIEPQYSDRIFAIFQRLHTRKEYSGTGLGLAICKKIVERHGGQIWLESQLGQGSTFYFTFPARASLIDTI